MITPLQPWFGSRQNSRRLQARSALPTVSLSTQPRAECMPPSLVSAPVVGSWWQRLMFWLMAPAPADRAPPPNRLLAVKREFGALLADVDNHSAERLRWRIAEAHSLRELWHLRSEVYAAIAVAHSQGEAESRLLLINAHFPTRAPRSQFATL
jgi:hypothetical protein